MAVAPTHTNISPLDQGNPSDTFSAVKPTIATILNTIPGIDPIYDLSIFDVLSALPDKGLYLVHYTATTSVTHGQLRGIIVDVVNHRIVCDSFGYTATVNLHHGIQLGPNGCYDLIDTDGHSYSIHPDNVTFKIGYEGTILRMFKHNGTVYMSTHRRIDASRSHWGNSLPFPQLYAELSGPKGEEIFPNDQDVNGTSPYVYIFLLVHPNVILATQEAIADGYIVFLGRRTMPLSDSPSVSTTSSPSDTDVVSEEIMFERYPRLRRPRDISLEEANIHLKHGYYPEPEQEIVDERLLKGEFVMMYIKESNKPTRLIKIQSIPYWWRTLMRDNNPNLLHRFYQLSDYANIRTEINVDNWNTYTALFPIVDDIEDVSNLGQPILGKATSLSTIESNNVLGNRENRLKNIWKSFLLAVPLNRQAEVFNIYKTFLQDRDDLIKWIVSLEQQEDEQRRNPSLAIMEISNRRILAIITSARQFARERRHNKRNITRNGNVMGMRSLIKDNIRNLIMKEKGPSLYHLIREMKST